jgi:hypothetical protein
MRASTGLHYVMEVSKELSEQAEILLHEIAAKDVPVDDTDPQVRLDWGIVRLVRRGNELLLEEPDYKSDPLRFVPGLNFTAAVLRAQQRVHARLGVSAEPVAYDQFMLVYPAGLTATRVAATRQLPQLQGDSGWRVFDASRVDWDAEPQARRVYEVAGERPALMGVLSLPVGWSLQLEDDTLAEVAPPNGEPIATLMALQL